MNMLLIATCVTAWLSLIFGIIGLFGIWIEIDYQSVYYSYSESSGIISYEKGSVTITSILAGIAVGCAFFAAIASSVAFCVHDARTFLLTTATFSFLASVFSVAAFADYCYHLDEYMDHISAIGGSASYSYGFGFEIAAFILALICLGSSIFAYKRSSSTPSTNITMVDSKV
mmetsp:Transcript_18579/g.32956  ORF Transcript_18579/g.32956 Transcript_18579/m.32956 type:complete len:172 (+) Transcript_18579:51-566(+)